MERLFKLSLTLVFTFLSGLSYAQSTGAPPKAPAKIAIDGFSYEPGSWMLPESHFVRAKMPMTLVHPRPDTETNTWARHRKAYPGLEYRIPIAVQGGAYPFNYEIIEGPSWLSIGATVWDENYGVLYGSPPMQEDGSASQTVKIRIYGQEHQREAADTVGPTYIESEFEIRVTSSTEDFVFVDSSVSQSGDGSLSSPLRSLAEIVDGNAPSTYAGRAIYFRAGYYYTTEFWGAFWKGEGNSGELNYGTGYPLVWLNYPGEEATVSFERAFLKPTTDLFVGGMKLHHSSQRSFGYRSPDTFASPSGFFRFTGGVVRITFFENEIAHLRRGWVDRILDHVYVSPTQFKVLGYDASVGQVYTVSVSGSAITGGNQLRFYDYVSPLTDADTHVGQSIVIQSVFDGTDTLVTVRDPVIPENLAQVRQLAQSGNDGSIYAAATSVHKPYWTFWGNHITDSRTKGIGSLYGIGPAVAEANVLTNSNSQHGIDFKSANTKVSFRRNRAFGSAYVYGALTNTGGTTGVTGEVGHAQFFEFCYNLLESPVDGTIMGPKWSSGGDMGHLAYSWVYRNTIIGRTRTAGGNSAGLNNIIYENNLYFTNSSHYQTGENVFASGDITGSFSGAQNYLDTNFQLRDEHSNLRGLKGHQILRAR